MSAPQPCEVERVVLRQRARHRSRRARPRPSPAARPRRPAASCRRRSRPPCTPPGSVTAARRIGKRVRVEGHVVLAHVGPAHGGAGVARREHPRPDVRVVVEPGDHDLVARPDRACRTTARQMEQHRRRVRLRTRPRPGSQPSRSGPRCAGRRPRSVDVAARRERAVGVRRARRASARRPPRSRCRASASRRARRPTRTGARPGRSARAPGTARASDVVDVGRCDLPRSLQRRNTGRTRRRRPEGRPPARCTNCGRLHGAVQLRARARRRSGPRGAPAGPRTGRTRRARRTAP